MIMILTKIGSYNRLQPCHLYHAPFWWYSLFCSTLFRCFPSIEVLNENNIQDSKVLPRRPPMDWKSGVNLTSPEAHVIIHSACHHDIQQKRLPSWLSLSAMWLSWYGRDMADYIPLTSYRLFHHDACHLISGTMQWCIIWQEHDMIWWHDRNETEQVSWHGRYETSSKSEEPKAIVLAATADPAPAGSAACGQGAAAAHAGGAQTAAESA